MKTRFLLPLLAMLAITGGTQAKTHIDIAGKAYDVDTLIKPYHVSPGVTFSKYDLPAMPLKICVLELDLTNPYLQVETCQGLDRAVGKESPVTMAQRNSHAGHEVVAAINGDFYLTRPATEAGTPLSGQIINGQVVENPNDRASLILDNKNRPYMDRVNFTATMSHGKDQWNITAVNRPRLDGDDQTLLITSAYGPATYAHARGTYLRLRPKKGHFAWKPNGKDVAVVDSIFSATASVLIPSGKAYVWVSGADSARAAGIKVGDKLTLSMNTSLSSQPKAKVKFKELVGGSNHIIMRDGKPVDAWDERHPRTMAGMNATGTKLYYVVVDGRSKQSVGMTLAESIGLFNALGAVTAVNLDGGGSSCMVVNGEVMNTPSDGHVRAVGNGSLIISTAPASAKQ